MKHRASTEDAAFRVAFEGLRVPPAEFDHAAHVRLAYVYLCEDSVEGAVARVKRALLSYLAHLGVDPAKYHETMTRAWVMAVDHFMQRSSACAAYADLVGINPRLLDSRIMLTHYSADLLFSPAARRGCIEPDLQSIPPPEGSTGRRKDPA